MKGRTAHRAEQDAEADEDVEAFDPDALEQLLADGGIDGVEYALCSEQGRTTAHALHPDGSLTCWHCGTTTTEDQ